MYSVEILRADAEGAQKTYPVVTGMLAVVAGITIFLSLQRLIQSQAKEIAVLRTLGGSGNPSCRGTLLRHFSLVHPGAYWVQLRVCYLGRLPWFQCMKASSESL